MKKSVLLMAACAAALGAPFADAQDQEPSNGDDAETRLEKVTVNARRVEESLQNVPITVTVVGAEDFQDKALFEFTDIGEITPGLRITGEAGGTNFVEIRGIGNLGTASPLSASVSLFLDQAPAPDAALLINSTLDIAQVEVLRGPQGTLYGTNATAGAINVYTQSPQLDGNSNAYLEGTYGVYDHNGNNTYELEGATDITLIEDVFGVRLAGSIRRDEGIVNNPFIGESINQVDHDNLRAKFIYDGGDSFDAGLTLGYFQGESQELFVVDVQGELGAGLFPAPAAFGNLDLFDYKSSQTPEKTPEEIFYGVLKLNWETPVGEVTSITSYVDQKVGLTRDGDNIGAFNDIVDFNFERDLFTQELRLSGSAFSDKLDYLFGGFYTTGERDTTSVVDFSDTGRIPTIFVDEGGGGEGYSLAFFTNNTLHLTDRWSVSGGVRVEELHREALDPFFDISASILSINTGGGLVANVFQDEIDETNVATSLKSTFIVNESLTLFAAFDQAFRGSGFNTAAPAAFLANGQGRFDTETVDAFEIGFKSSGWLHDRLTLNGSVYYQSFEDFQLQTFNPVSFADITPILQASTEAALSLAPGTLQFLGYPSSDGVFLPLPTSGLVINAPEAENSGIELEFEFEATEHFTLSGALSTNDFGFEGFDGVPTSPELADPAVVPDATLSTFGFGTVYAGQNAQAVLDAFGALQSFPPGTLPVTGDIVSASTIPTQALTGFIGASTPFSFTLAGEYQRDVNFLGQNEGFLRAVYAYNDQDSPNSPTIIEEYATLDVFAGLLNEADGWSVQLFATNVLNEEYALNVTTDIDSPFGPRALPAAPRQIGVTVRKNF